MRNSSIVHPWARCLGLWWAPSTVVASNKFFLESIEPLQNIRPKKEHHPVTASLSKTLLYPSPSRTDTLRSFTIRASVASTSSDEIQLLSSHALVLHNSPGRLLARIDYGYSAVLLPSSMRSDIARICMSFNPLDI
jgi:hypothetical protein